MGHQKMGLDPGQTPMLNWMQSWSQMQMCLRVTCGYLRKTAHVDPPRVLHTSGPRQSTSGPGHAALRQLAVDALAHGLDGHGPDGE